MNTAVSPGKLLSGGQVAGDTVHISGQVAVDPANAAAGLVGGGNTGKEAEQVLKNLKAKLEEAGSSLSNVMMCTCYLADLGDVAEFNAVYTSFFTKDPPARACFAVTNLPRGAKVEVSCTASLSGGNKAVAPGPVLSGAQVLGDIVRVSGQVGIDKSQSPPALVGDGDVAAEAKQALLNLKNQLEEVGASLSGVMMCTCYLADINLYPAFNEVYTEVFSTNPPARACFAVKSLPRGAKVEISCTASISGANKAISPGKFYSGAQVAGNLVHVSGQLGIDKANPSGGLIGDGDVAKEATQALLNLKNQLQEAGSSISNVLMCTCYLNDIADYAGFNSAWTQVFGEEGEAKVHPPARACFSPGTLPLGGKVEVSCVAVRSHEHHSVVIIGGGIGGLHTALRLNEAGQTDIKLYEGRGALGGRVVTTRDADGKPMFNDFAWRIGETNTNMLALTKELGIELRQQVTPEHLTHKGSHSDSCADESHPDVHETPAGRAPLSAYASQCLESTKKADQVDRESGYAGRMAQVSFPHESHGNVNYMVINGMNEIAQKLAAKLPAGMVNPHHRCKDVKKLSDGRYLVELVVRDGNNYSQLTVTCDTLVLAAPPVSLRAFTIAKRDGLFPVLFAIHQRRLLHGYVQSSPKVEGAVVPDRSDVNSRIYQGVPDSILQQIVSGDYGHGIWQAAYACDRFERVWRELQFQGPQVVKAEIEKQLAKLDIPAVQGLNIDQVFLRSGFVHRWQIEAHANGKTKEELSAQAVYPQPVQLPRLHLVGEAYSSEQGWTEGALLTSMAVVDHILNKPAASNSKHAQALPAPVPKAGADQMAYRGLVIDVSSWRERHPGGTGMIQFHGGEVIDELFDNFHAGWPAPLATLFGMQEGVLEK